MTRAASPPRSRVPIGAHCHGGLQGAVKKALAIGARPFQIFIGSPQTWRQADPGDAVVARFREEVAAHRLGPVFVHGTYLVNLAAENGDFLRKSVAALAWQLRQAERAGAAGVIFHPGSAGRADRAPAWTQATH